MVKSPFVCAVVIASSLPMLSAQAPVNPTFEVASIKPNKSGDQASSSFVRPGSRYNATNVTLRMLMRSAYGVHDMQIAGSPSWIDSERFDSVANAEGDQPTSMFRGQARLMLRSLLADRFKLVLHNETRELPIYALVVARGDRKLGPQLQPSDAAECEAVKTRSPIPATAADPPLSCGGGFARTGRLAARGSVLSDLVTSISNAADRIVRDRTELSGNFDWDLQWTPEQFPQTEPSESVSFFTALQEQLGLKLESTRGPVDVLVIDRVELPSAD
jgi:uncharacterized protein (TIGR03435 family)